MNRARFRTIGIGLSLAFLAALGSCEEKRGPAVMHQITGKLATESGEPLSNVKVAVFGYPGGTADTFSNVVDVAGPAQRYSIDVPEGTYDAPRASIFATYNGRKYMLALASADNTRDWGEQRDSKEGLTRDFVWRLSGPRPLGIGENKELAGFWGASINLDKGADVGDFGTVEVTLTPDGPLIDGSPGKVLSYKRVIPWQKHEDHLLTDVPVGRYVATAKMSSGGSEKAKPLRLVVTSGDPTRMDESSSGETADKAVVEFEQAVIKPGARPGQEPRFYVPTLMIFPEKERRP